MNGRVYDPYLGRFLSPDPIIDGVGSSQGFNRYAYLANNPLNGIDPSGFKKDVDPIWGWWFASGAARCSGNCTGVPQAVTRSRPIAIGSNPVATFASNNPPPHITVTVRRWTEHQQFVHGQLREMLRSLQQAGFGQSTSGRLSDDRVHGTPLTGDAKAPAAPTSAGQTNAGGSPTVTSMDPNTVICTEGCLIVALGVDAGYLVGSAGAGYYALVDLETGLIHLFSYWATGLGGSPAGLPRTAIIGTYQFGGTSSGFTIADQAGSGIDLGVSVAVKGRGFSFDVSTNYNWSTFSPDGGNYLNFSGGGAFGLGAALSVYKTRTTYDGTVVLGP